MQCQAAVLTLEELAWYRILTQTNGLHAIAA